MQSKIVKIGNSKGIRIPNSILKELFIGEARYVELEVKDGVLHVKPVLSPRIGWEDKFKLMHEEGDDELILGDGFSDETESEDWEWN